MINQLSPLASVSLTHPQIIQHLASSLVISWDFCRKILIETWFDRTDLWKRGPIILLHCEEKEKEEVSK